LGAQAIELGFAGFHLRLVDTRIDLREELSFMDGVTDVDVDIFSWPETCVPTSTYCLGSSLPWEVTTSSMVPRVTVIGIRFSRCGFCVAALYQYQPPAAMPTTAKRPISLFR
jgi:hypothetical protein